MSARCPWDKCDLLKFIMELRNRAVAKAMQDVVMIHSDPAADEVVGTPMKKTKRDVIDKIDKVFTITLPALGTAHEHAIKVLSSERDDNILKFELTKENLDYFGTVVQEVTTEELQGILNKPLSRESGTSPIHVPESCPKVKLQKNAKRTILYCRFTDADGKTKQHS